MGASIILGYHQAQMEAEDALAQKIVLPEHVIVQAFSGARNENELNEVHLLAEVATDRIIRLDVGNGTASRMVEIVPIYPVSRRSYPIARSLSDSRRRPTPRSEAAAIADSNAQLARIENLAVGLLVFDVADTPALPYLDDRSLVEGQSGVLVNVPGISIGNSQILQNAKAPMSKLGVDLIDDALVISPLTQGRPAGVKGSDYSTLQNGLLWASVAMIAFGLASLFSVLPSFKKTKLHGKSSEVKAVGSRPVIDPFQPIAGQDELGDEIEERNTHRASRIMTVASSVFRTKSRP